MQLEFKGIHKTILDDISPEIDVEGSLNSGKTTLGIWRQLEKLKRYPEMWAFAFRYSDSDTRNKLKPAIEFICNLRGETPKWDNTEMFYRFDNGSRLYCFGLKAVDLLSRYSKLRGLGVSDIYSDQTEELPKDLAGELRARLRPDLRMTLLKQEFPRQLFLTPNPPHSRHWLAKEYPTDNSIPGRRYYSLSVYDNQHNIGPEAVRMLEASFPPGHARHSAMVLGQRGMNVIGDAVFETSFNRRLHIAPLTYNPDELLYEAFDIGRHCPCWMIGQRNLSGGWMFLGGIIGEDQFLEDFLPVVKQARRDWFGDLQRKHVRTTCMIGSTAAFTNRYTDSNILRDAGFDIESREHANSPDVILAMIELLAGYMRRRDSRGKECFRVNDADDHWLKASREGVEPSPFFAQGLESGIVWDDNMISVGHKEVRRVKDDDWFDHGLRCAVGLELNFGADNLTPEERLRRVSANRTLPSLGRQSGPSTGWML